MKKLLTLLLTAALATAAATTAFADDTTISAGTDGKPSPTAAPQMNVTYTVQPSYTVTIPASVTLGEKATVSASGVKINKNQNLIVKLTGTSGNNNAFTVTANGAELAYTVKNGTTDIAVGSEVLNVNSTTASNKLSAELSFVAPTSTTYAGNYTGTVTFTVSVE